MISLLYETFAKIYSTIISDKLKLYSKKHAIVSEGNLNSKIWANKRFWRNLDQNWIPIYIDGESKMWNL